MLYGAALCSPAVMLGIERGNVDLLLFAIVTLAVVVARARPVRPDPRGSARPGRGRPQALPDLLARAAGAPAAARLHRRHGRRALRSLRARHPRRHSHDRQGRAAGERLLVRDRHLRTVAREPARHRRLGRPTPLSSRSRWPRRSSRERGSDRLPTPGPRQRAASADLDAFWAGAGVYVATFCLFHSFDYRLVFLLLTIPQLLRWARRAEPVAWVSLAALLDDGLADRPVRAPRGRGRADGAPRGPGRRSDRNGPGAGSGGGHSPRRDDANLLSRPRPQRGPHDRGGARAHRRARPRPAGDRRRRRLQRRDRRRSPSGTTAWSSVSRTAARAPRSAPRSRTSTGRSQSSRTPTWSTTRPTSRR